MIYSWYWYNRNAVIGTLPKTFAEMMENPFLRDLGCYARHLQPYLDRFPAENILVIQFDAIRRAIQTTFAGAVYEFLKVDPDFKPQLEQKGQNAARAPRFPLLQSSAQRVLQWRLRASRVGKVLKSPSVAKSLQSVYHRLNSKAQKYEPLTPQERLKWEKYYSNDQEELSHLLRGLRVIA